MRLNTLHKSCGLLAMLVAALAVMPAASRAEEEADFQKLLAEKTPAIVTVKFVLKIKSNWGENESEQEITGVVISEDGLVLCANSMLGGGSWVRRSGGTATPTDIKVLIGDDTEGREAKLIARDTELDLTWLKIKEPGDKKLAFVNLTSEAKPAIGDRIYSISRLPKYFDRVAVVRAGRLGGITTKPRKLFVPNGGGGGLGLPVYNAKREIIGVLVMQSPDEDEMEGGGYMGGASLILPAGDVAKATKRALQATEDEDDENLDDEDDGDHDGDDDEDDHDADEDLDE